MLYLVFLCLLDLLLSITIEDTPLTMIRDEDMISWRLIPCFLALIYFLIKLARNPCFCVCSLRGQKSFKKYFWSKSKVEIDRMMLILWYAIRDADFKSVPIFASRKGTHQLVSGEQNWCSFGAWFRRRATLTGALFWPENALFFFCVIS